MRVTQRLAYQNGASDPESAWSALEADLAAIQKALNAVSFGTPEDGAIAEQFAGRWLVYTTNAVADTDDVVRHRLGRTPIGFFQVERPLRTGETPNSGFVYWGTGPSATPEQVTLRCSGASKVVYILLF